MKIAVYAICKNEAAHVSRFLDSCIADADRVVVCDTGSTDTTWSRLAQFHATRKLDCHQLAVRPWRFDDARNASLAMVPDDIDVCVPLDLDEVMTPGWRARIEAAWQPATTRLRYPFVWNYSADGKPLTFFNSDKIHARYGYRWVGPCHEALHFQAGDGFIGARNQEIFAAIGGGPLIEHRADDMKRRDYLPLLERAVRERPDDDRMAHYYGRELFYRGLYDDAISVLGRHLDMVQAQWPPERAASWRYIAKCWVAKSLPVVSLACAERALLHAVEEDPNGREPWLDLAEMFAKRNEFAGALWAVTRCLAITDRAGTYISEARCWDGTPEKLRIYVLCKLGLEPTAFAELHDLALARGAA
jgi:glycosyltransferase involved in cell wall biosynthesis